MTRIFKGSSLAASVFDQQIERSVMARQPIQKHQFYVKLNYDPMSKAMVDLFLADATPSSASTLIKSITMPSFTIDTQIFNEYNRKRVVQNRIDNDPVSITFHDVMGGLTLSIWQLYYNYYFNDGLSNLELKKEWLYSPPWEQIDFNALSSVSGIIDKVTSDGSNITALKGFGYSAPVFRYLYKSIEIFQITGGQYNKVTLFNPIISNFRHGEMAYDSSDAVDMTYTFDYEWAEYEIENNPLGDESEIFNTLAKADPIEYASFAEPVRQARKTTLSENNTPVGRIQAPPATDVVGPTNNFGTNSLASQLKFATVNKSSNKSEKISSRSFEPNHNRNTNEYRDVRRTR